MKNICIVGYGNIGLVHAEALKDIENASVYAVCDTDEKRLNAAKTDLKSKLYSDFEKCLEDEKIDYFHICTPHYLHFEMIKKVLEKGKIAVVEKPHVMKREQMDVLLSKYDTKRIIPIFQNRENECVKKMKNLTENRTDFGKLICAKGILTWSRDADYYNSAPWRGTKKYEGGSALINQAIHTLDIMSYFCGGATDAQSSFSNHSLKGVIETEDTVEAYITYKNGVKGIFYATNAYLVSSSMDVELVFENAILRYMGGSLYLNGEKICTDKEGHLGKLGYGRGHRDVFYNLYQKNIHLCFEDVKNTLDAMFKIYECQNKEGDF